MFSADESSSTTSTDNDNPRSVRAGQPDSAAVFRSDHSPDSNDGELLGDDVKLDNGARESHTGQDEAMGIETWLTGGDPIPTSQEHTASSLERSRRADVAAGQALSTASETAPVSPEVSKDAVVVTMISVDKEQQTVTSFMTVAQALPLVTPMSLELGDPGRDQLTSSSHSSLDSGPPMFGNAEWLPPVDTQAVSTESNVVPTNASQIPSASQTEVAWVASSRGGNLAPSLYLVMAGLLLELGHWM